MSNAGIVWRQLAVIALMPWLQKYRVCNKERQKEALDGLQRQQSSRKSENGIPRDKSWHFDAFRPATRPEERDGSDPARKIYAHAIRKLNARFGNYERRHSSLELFQDCDSDEFSDATSFEQKP